MTGWSVAVTVAVPVDVATSAQVVQRLCAWCEEHCWDRWSWSMILPDRAFFGFADCDDADDFMVQS